MAVQLGPVSLSGSHETAAATTKTSLTQLNTAANMSPMKKQDLLRELAAIAHSAGLGLRLPQKGQNHEIWMLGNERMVIPRHGEINVNTARAILTDTARWLNHET